MAVSNIKKFTILTKVGYLPDLNIQHSYCDIIVHTLVKTLLDTLLSDSTLQNTSLGSLIKFTSLQNEDRRGCV